jgi:hypothetical protein
VPISPELEERVAKAWFESIPEQYRLSRRDKGMYGDRLLSAAIILPPPPLSLITAFLLGVFGPRHLTRKQLAAKQARQNSGRRPGRKKDDDLTRIRIQPSRARPKPSVPLATIVDLCDDGKATILSEQRPSI